MNSGLGCSCVDVGASVTTSVLSGGGRGARQAAPVERQGVCRTSLTPSFSFVVNLKLLFKILSS